MGLTPASRWGAGCEDSGPSRAGPHLAACFSFISALTQSHARGRKCSQPLCFGDVGAGCVLPAPTPSSGNPGPAPGPRLAHHSPPQTRAAHVHSVMRCSHTPAPSPARGPPARPAPRSPPALKTPTTDGRLRPLGRRPGHRGDQRGARLGIPPEAPRLAAAPQQPLRQPQQQACCSSTSRLRPRGEQALRGEWGTRSSQELARAAPCPGPPEPGLPGPLPTCPRPGLALGASPEAGGLGLGLGRAWRAPGAAVCPWWGPWEQTRRRPPAPVTGRPTGRALALRLAGLPGRGDARRPSQLPALLSHGPSRSGPEATGPPAPEGLGTGLGQRHPRLAPSRSRPQFPFSQRALCCPVWLGLSGGCAGPAPPRAPPLRPSDQKAGWRAAHVGTPAGPGPGRAVTPPHTKPELPLLLF